MIIMIATAIIIILRVDINDSNDKKTVVLVMPIIAKIIIIIMVVVMRVIMNIIQTVIII